MEFDVTTIQILALLVFVHLFFIYAISKKRNDIADVAWGLGFVLLALIGVIYNYNTKTFIIFLLVSVWGIRLFSYILKKFRREKAENARYRKWRAGWGSRWILFSYLKVFLLQGFSLILVAMPILILSRFSMGDWSLVNTFGVILWLFGFVFEIIGDKQLFNFVKTKKPGEIMTRGLWKYTRHPNYFGEAVLWWGIWLISIGSPYYYIGLIGPVTITFLLRFVSGVPMAEERYQDNQAFQEYKQKTPAMIPNFFIK
jgi:steroid 5-alpha reductase family enzyme